MAMMFKLFRASVVPEDGLFRKDLTPGEKTSLLERAISKREKAEYRNTDYQFANIEEVQGHLFGRIIRPDDVELSLKDPQTGDLVDKDVLAFAWTHFVYLGLNTQVFAVLNKIEFFSGKEAGTARILEMLLRAGSPDPSQSIFVEPITSEQEFWDIVTNAQAINAVNMEFVTPNVFGGGENIRDFLRHQREAHNAGKVKVTLSNSESKLRVDRTNLGQEIDYVSRGGGGWWIRFRDATGIWRRRTSRDSVTTATVPNEGDPPESLVGKIGEVITAIRKHL